MAYDPLLGWVPRSDHFSANWSSNVDASGLRRNGVAEVPRNSGRPILAVGDSFTFGDDVEDDETWASLLERSVNRRVLNAGVSAYGVDQAVLRAERLLPTYDPSLVILSFISNDIDRTEYSHFIYGGGEKPFFEMLDGRLTLRNSPVPRSNPRWKRIQCLLGFSMLADAILGRVAPRWWRNLPDAPITRVHRDGERVSVELIARLDSLARSRHANFVAVALAARVGGNERLPRVVNGLRSRGVEVLDLSAEMLNLPTDQFESLFLRGGHYTPATNRWLAERLHSFIRANRMAILPPESRAIAIQRP
jgi:hypothetical protein